MTRTSTLSQNFDSGSFISPDILAAVNASVRAAAENILERDGLVSDIERIIDLRADVPSITDTTFGGLVPSMNPDDFIKYDRPGAPVMAGFEVFEPAPVSIARGHESDEPGAGEGGAYELPAIQFDSLNIEVIIPDLVAIEQTADLIQDDIALEMPEISRFNANLFRVKLDTLRFNMGFRQKLRLVILIAIIAFVNVLLIMYLFS